jgi:uncharacterized protein (DUF3820 family)
MPFGKHKGTPLSSLPSSYVRWLLAQPWVGEWGELREALRSLTPPPLSDEDPMPFGKFKGLDMVSLPPSYVAWLLAQPWIDDWPEVAAYLRENREEFARAGETERMWKRLGVLRLVYPPGEDWTAARF